VREAAAAGVRIEPIPGPSAPFAALVVSGLPPYPFTFAGFPPPKSGKRRTFYKGWAALGHTLVVFESPHRLLASLEDALAELGDRPAAIAGS
jgi:16S rRNA (cytidine1402-2'-O)-methyltransferase